MRRLVLALLAACLAPGCAQGEMPCRVATDCESGVCLVDGTCMPLPDGASDPTPDELRLISLAELGELEKPAAATWPPFEAEEAALSGASGRAEAQDLVQNRTRRARDLVERILWDGFQESAAQEPA